VSFEASVVEITDEIRRAASESLSETDLQFRVEHTLRVKVFDKLGIPWGRYNYTLVSGIRPDALYGHVIIEYEKPGTLKSKRGFEHATAQAKNYICDKARTEAQYERFFGVVLDGFLIGFVRYRAKQKTWEVSEPFEVNPHTVLKLLEAVRGLARKPLDAEFLIKDLGPESSVAKSFVRTLYQGMSRAKSGRTKMLFDDWRRVFSQVCAYSPLKLGGLETAYGVVDKRWITMPCFSVSTPTMLF
jgi:hypothetical protein